MDCGSGRPVLIAIIHQGSFGGLKAVVMAYSGIRWKEGEIFKHTSMQNKQASCCQFHRGMCFEMSVIQSISNSNLLM